MMQRNRWFLSTDLPFLPSRLRHRFLFTRICPTTIDSTKVMGTALFSYFSHIIGRRSKINAFIPLWDNRWWKCYEKLSQTELCSASSNNGWAGAGSICHSNFWNWKFRFFQFWDWKFRFFQIWDWKFKFISVSSALFGRCLVFRPRQSGDWTRLEMRPLPKSEMRQKSKVNRNKAIFS